MTARRMTARRMTAQRREARRREARRREARSREASIRDLQRGLVLLGVRDPNQRPHEGAPLCPYPAVAPPRGAAAPPAGNHQTGWLQGNQQTGWLHAAQWPAA